jgi:hypothetical protein
MARERLCKVCRGWHDLDEPWPDNCRRERIMTRSDLPTPMVITDTMEPVQSMLDGKYYTSKSKLRETYRAAGVTEVGNDPSVTDPKPHRKPKPSKAEARAAIDKAFSRAGLGA